MLLKGGKCLKERRSGTKERDVVILCLTLGHFGRDGCLLCLRKSGTGWNVEEEFLEFPLLQTAKSKHVEYFLYDFPRSCSRKENIKIRTITLGLYITNNNGSIS